MLTQKASLGIDRDIMMRGPVQQEDITALSFYWSNKIYKAKMDKHTERKGHNQKQEYYEWKSSPVKANIQ